MTQALEAGIRAQRVEYYEESGGTLPNGGTFTPFSDTVRGFRWAADANMEARRGIGSVYPKGHDTGLETHTITVTYLLQGAIEDGTPLYEAFQRDCDGLLTAFTILQREDHCNGGNDNSGLRTYVVAEGCKPASAVLRGDPGTPGPMEAEVVYTAEKAREYVIHQPASSSTLTVVSTNANDDATLTVESDNGETSESIALTGTTKGTMTTGFTSVDAIELGASQAGTITVATVAGTVICVLYGSDAYANAEGDLGVPVYPTSATRVTSLGSAYEKFLGDTITYAGGTLAYDINSVELTVDNSVTTLPRSNSLKQRVIEGNQVVQVRTTVVGETEHFDQVQRHLQSRENDIAWFLTASTLTVEEAAMISAPEKALESGQAFMQLDCLFEGTALTIT